MTSLTTEQVLAQSRAQLDKAHQKIVKDISTYILIKELEERGYDVFLKQDPPKPHVDFAPLPGPPAAGYTGLWLDLPTGDRLVPWVPKDDRRPATSARFGMTREINRYLGSAKRGECTNCLKNDDKISPAAWRMMNGTGTTSRTLCLDCAEAMVARINSGWNTKLRLPNLTPVRVLEVPTFATAEEALAWLDEHE